MHRVARIYRISPMEVWGWSMESVLTALEMEEAEAYLQEQADRRAARKK